MDPDIRDYIGDGSCDPTFDCMEFDFDGGDCPSAGELCTLEGDSCGLSDCYGECGPDTLGDGVCDESLNCADMEYDAGDCLL